MQVQSINNQSPVIKNPQFKAAYPVVHWVAETNGSYAPVVTTELTRKLQRALITALNSAEKNTPIVKKVKEYMKKCDMDFRKDPQARSYYYEDGGWHESLKKFFPMSYMITGKDVETFNKKYGKNVGKAKSASPYINGKKHSAELSRAQRDYATQGFAFVLDKDKRIYDSDGIEYALHTKFQTIRSKSGREKGFKLIDVKFCPEKGPNNPFVRVGLSEAE